MPPQPFPAPRSDRRDTDRQLAALFGESLAGPWPELGSQVERAGSIRRWRIWPWWLGALVLTVAVALGTRALVGPGLERRSAEDRGEHVERLRMSLEDGHLEHAAELLDLVRPPTPDLDPVDPHLEQLLRAEAAVYRYFDADPARLARIRPYLPGEASAAVSASRQVAYFAVLCREERAQHLVDLERLRNRLPRDAEVHYLVASAQEQKGMTAAAREAYGRSADLGPAWLHHRFDQLEFERQQGDLRAAVETATDMLRSDPGSPWSRLAASLTELPVPAVDPDRDAPVSSPVQVFRMTLLQAGEAAIRGDGSRAEQSLDAAVAAVHGEAPFLIDAFDYLERRGSLTLARRLTEARAWPKDSATAAVKRRRIAGASMDR
ncbi:MAG: hypothetical protein JW751_24855 [Polyangiaceae bacterium]|nr:hypothetical protein [Polyangiaceae bacterium]